MWEEMKNFTEKQKLKVHSKILTLSEGTLESLPYRKAVMLHRGKGGKVTTEKQITEISLHTDFTNFCESDNHNEQQKNEHEDIKVDI